MLFLGKISFLFLCVKYMSHKIYHFNHIQCTIQGYSCYHAIITTACLQKQNH